MPSATDFLPSYISAFMKRVMHDVAELGVRQDLALHRAAAAASCLRFSLYFGRLAPYSERRWRRLAMPWVSSTPRRMW